MNRIIKTSESKAVPVSNCLLALLQWKSQTNFLPMCEDEQSLASDFIEQWN